jgi:hypothetical protein
MGVETAGAASLCTLGTVMSAELVQEQKTARQYDKGNPEVEVGGNYAEEVAGCAFI